MSFSMTISKNNYGIFVGLVECLLLIFLGTRLSFAASDPLKLQEELTLQMKINEMRKTFAAQGVQFISAYEALNKFNAGKLLLLDVNGKGFYECEHILNAVNCEDVSKARNLPKQIEIGIYCR